MTEPTEHPDTSWRRTPRFWVLTVICFFVVGGVGLLSWLISNYL